MKSFSSVLEYLEENLKYHCNNTPFYERRCSAELLKAVSKSKSWEELAEILFNSRLLADVNILREIDVVYNLIPRNFPKPVEFSKSSGTTGPPKLAPMSEDYIEYMASKVAKFIKQNYNLKNLDGYLFVGPPGPYMSAQKKLAEYLNIKYIYPEISVDLDLISKRDIEGLPSLLAKEYLSHLLNKLAENLIKYKVSLLRVVPQMIYPIANLILEKGVKGIIVSGVQVTPYEIEKLNQALFSKIIIIPVFGYFGNGDSPGKYENGKIKYCAILPNNAISPLKYENGRYKVVDYGEEGKLGIIIVRPEFLLITVENDIATREKGLDADWPIAFSNPRREVKPS